MKPEPKILLSRLMTRSGDQAWDFAVLIVLMEIFPNELRIAFFYFFILKLSSVFFMPSLGKVIDHQTRRFSLALGTGLQLSGVLLISFLIYFHALDTIHTSPWFYTALILGGTLSSLGSTVMDIAVANDMVPTVLPVERLPKFNSRIRQTDLLTEVAAPIVAGAILMIKIPAIPYFGFFIIALWNVLTFFPEYFLLNSILKANPGFNVKASVPSGEKSGPMKKLAAGWNDFRVLPVSASIIAYSLLWISVLSPYSVLLSAFLKAGWHLPESVIGLFRGLGALFGLIATLVYPWLRRKKSTVLSAQYLVVYQAITVLLCLFFFMEGSEVSKYLFLIFIMLSRIGLWGFSLGEVEIRQKFIPENVRGKINGVASSLNSLATLAVYSLGILWSTPIDFKYLVILSTSAVVVAAIYFVFVAKPRLEQQEN
jgi:iron-regulated transporter 1